MTPNPSTFHSKRPTRIDLAGGTLDCWPLFLLVGQAITVNASISIFTQAQLTASDKIKIEIKDLNFHREYVSIDELLADKSPELDLVRVHVNYWKPSHGFTLTTSSESPLGGGIGGSSSLCIALIDVFSQWLGVKLSISETVTLAGNLEAQLLKKPTGTQDYFGALSWGLNAIHYTPAGARLERLEADLTELNKRLSIVYTGQPHHSGINNWSVLKAAMDQDAKTLEMLTELKRIADQTYRACQQNQWTDLAQLFREEFKARVELSSGFSSPSILRLEDLVLNAGGDAVKICGAGGGGCVFVWSSPERKESLRQVCQQAGYRVLDAKIVENPLEPKRA